MSRSQYEPQRQNLQKKVQTWIEEQPERSLTTKPRTFDDEDTISEYTASGILTPTSSRFTSPTRSIIRGRRRRESEPDRERTPTGLEREKTPTSLSLRETIANEARRKRVGREEVLGEGSSDSDRGSDSGTETTRTRTPTPMREEEEEPRVKPFRCLICQRRFDTDEEAKDHMAAYGLKKGDTHTQIIETPDYYTSLNGNKNSKRTPPSPPPELATVTHTLFDFPSGTATLRLQSIQTIHIYQVSSQILQLSSPALYKKLSLSTSNTLTLHEDSPTMLLLILRMLHHQYSLLPTGFESFQALIDFTVIIDKYGLVASVYPPVKEWVRKWRTDNHYHWIFVAHVFGFEEDVREATTRLGRGISDYSFDAVIDLQCWDESDTLMFLHPRLPKEITDQIRTYRSKNVEALRMFIQQSLTEKMGKGWGSCELSWGESSTMSRCDMLQLGHLMKTVVEHDLQPDGKIWKQSLNHILKTLEGVRGVFLGHGHDTCTWVGPLRTLLQTFSGQDLNDGT